MGKIELSASQEDYLEAIYCISEEKRAARAKDIAQYLNVNGSSVTGALRTLAQKGLVNYAPYDIITLTDNGEEVAEEVHRRHAVLKNFLTSVLKVSEEEANDAACKMEHVVSKNIVNRLVQFAEFIDTCTCNGEDWGESFIKQCCSDEQC